jgi:hypothetical protein
MHTSSNVIMDDMGMMGLGYDQGFDGGQNTTPVTGGANIEHCPIPLQDLIHENLIS